MNLATVQLIGNLGADPEMRYTPSGTAVTSFSLAVNRRGRAVDGEQLEQVDWYRVSCWNQTAEIADQYLKKGTRVFVAGRQQIRKYVTKDGRPGTAVEVAATELVILTPRGETVGATAAAVPAGDLDDVPF